MLTTYSGYLFNCQALPVGVEFSETKAIKHFAQETIVVIPNSPQWTFVCILTKVINVMKQVAIKIKQDLWK